MINESDAWLQKVVATTKNTLSHVSKSSKGEAVACGDRFIFKDACNIAVFWVAVRQNRDDPKLWYFVAADTMTYIGSSDVATDDHSGEAGLVLRCGNGLWLRETDLDKGVYLGRVESSVIDYATEKLQLMVMGELVGSPLAELTDIDSDYLDWIEQIHTAVFALENQIQRKRQIYSFRLQAPVTINVESDFVMAAATGENIIVDDNAALQKRIIINEPFDGKLEISCDEDVLHFVYHSEQAEPPVLVTVNERPFEGSWGDPVGGIYWLDQPITKTGELMDFVFAPGGTIQIDVSNAT